MLRVLALLALLAAPALAGCLQGAPGAAVPEGAAPDAPGLVAVPGALIETDLGDMEVFLYPEHVPATVANFQALAGAGFYDGLVWHRVVDDFVIQTGDPSGSGVLGSDESVALETHPDLHFAAGAVGMARDVDPDSANSQFFITEKPATHLHDPQGATGDVFGAYSLFGQVRRKDYRPEDAAAPHGLGAVRNISGVATIPGLDRPIEDVHVRRITLVTLTVTAEEWSHYPLRTFGRASDGVFTYVLETPRAFHAGAAPVAIHWYLTPAADGAAAPAEAHMAVKGPDGARSVPLAPNGDDAYILKGDLGFVVAGDHEVTLVRDGARGVTFTVPVGA